MSDSVLVVDGSPISAFLSPKKSPSVLTFSRHIQPQQRSWQLLRDWSDASRERMTLIKLYGKLALLIVPGQTRSIRLEIPRRWLIRHLNGFKGMDLLNVIDYINVCRG